MRRHAPALTLFLLSPFLAEVVFGATPLSRLGGLVPLLFFYGGGVLNIRDLARRRGRGWWRILLLGAAYAIVEEGLVIQSVFNPDLFRAGELGGRALGVNGVWTEWTIAYHATYSVAIPILLAEILFPSRRDEPWLGPRSMAFLGLLYLLSAAVIGIAFRRIIAPGFQATILQVLAASGTVVLLVIAALRGPEPNEPREDVLRPVPPRGLVALLGLAGGAAIFALLVGIPGPWRHGIGVLVPMGAVAVVLGFVLLSVARWWGRAAWTDRHALALVGGALVPMMLFGLLAVTAGNRTDQVADGVFIAVTWVFLAALDHAAGGRGGSPIRAPGRSKTRVGERPVTP